MNPYNMTRAEVKATLENDYGTTVYRDESTGLIRDCLADCLWPDFEHVARVLFVTAYADAVDRNEIEGEKPGAGGDWEDVAPETSESAKRSAAALLERFELEHGKGAFYAACCLWTEATGLDSESFGHHFGFQALGHGVGLDDDMPYGAPRFEPAPPNWEFYLEAEPHRPGKFEGEPGYVPVLWSRALECGADEETATGYVFLVTEALGAAFPELEGSYALFLEESDQGFVYSNLFETKAEYDSWLDENP